MSQIIEEANLRMSTDRDDSLREDDVQSCISSHVASPGIFGGA